MQTTTKGGIKMKAVHQKKILVRMLVTVLTLAFLFAIAAPALAAGEQVYATTGLNVRSGPGVKHPVIGGLEKGDTVTRIGTSGKWSVIIYNGSKAYAYSKYLNLKDGGSGSNAAAQIKMYATTTVNVRAGASAKTTRLGSLNKGDLFVATGVKNGNWVQGVYNGKTAYVYGKYLTLDAPSAPQPPQPTAPAAKQLFGAANTNTSTYLHKEPSATSAVLTTVPTHQALVCLGGTGIWTYVQIGKNFGYILTSSIAGASGASGASGALTHTEVYFYAAGSVPVYETVSTAGTIKTYLVKDQRVFCSAKNDLWAYVTTEAGISGFVLMTGLTNPSSQLISVPTPPVLEVGVQQLSPELYKYPAPIVKKTNSSFVPVLKSPSEDMTNKVSTIRAIRTAVRVIGVEGEYSFITVTLSGESVAGYVRTEYLDAV